MSKNVYIGEDEVTKNPVYGTVYCGHETLLDSEVTRRCVQLTSGPNHISLTMREFRRLSRQVLAKDPRAVVIKGVRT